MSRFYATIQGTRGEASRMGGKESGISGHVRGWNVGVSVDGHADDHPTEQDVFVVRATGGSNGSLLSVPVATIWRDGDRILVRVDVPAENRARRSRR